jgi:hypothetical protein
MAGRRAILVASACNVRAAYDWRGMSFPGAVAACAEAGAARRAARWQEVSAAEPRALVLWRGTPLLDVPSQVLGAPGR